MADKPRFTRRGLGVVMLVVAVIAIITAIWMNNKFDVSTAGSTRMTPCVGERNRAGIVVAECRKEWEHRQSQRWIWGVSGGVLGVGGVLLVRKR